MRARFPITQPAAILVSYLAALLMAALVSAAPDAQADTPDSGPAAPEFTGIDHWLNSAPLTLRQLRGKVVLLDFWTYDCINCIDTLPHLVDWYQRFQSQGLVVVGVHTPEFPAERDTEQLKAAIQRYKITYPVAQDNQYATWNAYNNQYWPAFYLVDRQGRLVYRHYGEGDYAQTAAAIRRALAQTQAPVR